MMDNSGLSVLFFVTHPHPHPINNVFVYPSDLNIDEFKDALSRSLSLWPVVAGRFFLADDDRYVIEMSDSGIPISLVENTELNRWPLDSNVLRDTAKGELTIFFDEVQDGKVFRNRHINLYFV